MIEELRAEGTTISTSIADHIESFTDYDFAHLLFSDGDVTQSISLEKQLNIIQVADLVLPDKETSFEEYTTMELLSVAMLIVISTLPSTSSTLTAACLRLWIWTKHGVSYRWHRARPSL